MSASSAKLALTLLAICLLLCSLPSTTSALVLRDDQKSSWHVDCVHGLTRVIGRKEGNFGCQNVMVGKKAFPFESLKGTKTSPPPPPTKNTASSSVTLSPPVAA